MIWLRIGLSFLIGCLLGVLFHYTLYRMGLPIEPFIYMAF
jgi:high-affinity Fe2+/Pb2+ permease